MKTVLATMLLLISMPAQNASTAASTAPTVAQLLGTWRLVAVVDTMKDGSSVPAAKYGPHAQGFIMYEPDGHMCAQIMNPDRPSWKDADNPTNEDKLAAFDGFIAYCGTYKLDADHSTLTHYPAVAWMPPYVGSTQPRPFRIEGKRLIITPANLDPSMTKEGIVKRVLTWERAE